MFRRALFSTLAPAAVALSFPMLLSGRRGVVALSLSEREKEVVPDPILKIPLPKRYLTSTEAREIDEALMSKPGFSIDQLMELAGLSVAKAAHVFAQDYCSTDEAKKNKILLVCGAWK